MIRLNMVVEGQTEETFARDVLAPHLAQRGVIVSARRVQTGSVRAPTGEKRVARGGVPSYGKLRRDVEMWLREDAGADARFTTMLDLYALPDDFPGISEAARCPDLYERLSRLEEAMRQDVGDWRFIPYLQAHEFEALVFADPTRLELEFPGREREIAQLVELVAAFPTPEHIDDGPDTAPSKRLLAVLPDYRKVTTGPIVVAAIGLKVIREKCRHFDQWLTTLEHLDTREAPGGHGHEDRCYQ